MVEQDFGGADSRRRPDRRPLRRQRRGRRRPAPATRLRPTRCSATRSAATRTPARSSSSSRARPARATAAARQKVFNAQQAGADGVILISLFGGFPSALSSGGEAITIPAVMITAGDGYALLDELSPRQRLQLGRGQRDARVRHDADPRLRGLAHRLHVGGPRPDHQRPQARYRGAWLRHPVDRRGHGRPRASSSRAPRWRRRWSPASPPCCARSTPNWKPARIKAVMMNQATRNVKNNDLSKPAPATVMGAGRVQADEVGEGRHRGRARQPLLRAAAADRPRSRLTRHFTVTQHGLARTTPTRSARTSATRTSTRRLTDVAGLDQRQLLRPGRQTSRSRSTRRRRSTSSSTADPSAITEADQENGFYAFNGTADGTVKVKQKGKKPDTIDVAWQTTPLAASARTRSPMSRSISAAARRRRRSPRSAARRVHYADLYLLGDRATPRHSRRGGHRRHRRPLVHRLQRRGRDRRGPARTAPTSSSDSSGPTS